MNASDGPILDQVNLVVRDMDAMAAFYGRLGLDLPATNPEWAAHHRNTETAGGIHFDLDSETFAAVWDEGWPTGRAGVVLGFRLPTRDAVDELHDELVAGGCASQQPPYDAFWGIRYAVVEDPDGNAVGLMSPIDPARRSPPTPPAPHPRKR
jgi:uncharacterized glyoxalase superfamily protein PhnB